MSKKTTLLSKNKIHGFSDSKQISAIEQKYTPLSHLALAFILKGNEIRQQEASAC